MKNLELTEMLVCLNVGALWVLLGCAYLCSHVGGCR